MENYETKLETNETEQETNEAELDNGGKSKGLAIVLSIFLGILGVDRFYYGYKFKGFLKLCTLGGFFMWWVWDIFAIITGSLKPNTVKKAEKAQEIAVAYQAVEDRHTKQTEALKQKLRDDGFFISGSKWCHDLCVKAPVEQGSTKRKIVYLTSKGFLLDNKNRRIAFAWLEDTPRVVYFDYSDIISCEILYDAFTRTNTTRVTTGTKGVYTGNSFSNSTDYIRSLGIKLMLRDPTNPKFIVPLITQQTQENDSRVQYCKQFAQEVKDSIYAILNG